MALCLICLVSFNYALTDSDIVSWWKLDTNTGTVTPDFNNYNDGVIRDTIITGATGILGNAMTTTLQSDAIDLNEIVWQPTTNFSGNLWFKGTSNTGNKLLHNFNANQDKYGWRLDSSSGLVRIAMGDGTTLVVASDTDTDNNIFNGNWRMITFTYDNNSIKLYIDGVFAKDASQPNPIAYHSGTKMTIGATWGDSIAQYVQGAIGTYDEVSVYNKVLTQTDIDELWNAGVGITPPIDTFISKFDYNFDIPNAEIDLNDDSVAEAGLIIDSWKWDINSVTVSTDQNFSFNATQNIDYNVCLTIEDTTDTYIDTNCQIISTGEWYDFTNNVTYTLDPINSKIDLNTLNPNVTYGSITGYKWLVNNTQIATTQAVSYYTLANLDLNVCSVLSGLGSDGNTYVDSNCQSILTWDTFNPIVDVNISDLNYGFVSDFNIAWDMACYDNFSPINYTVTWVNGSTVTYLYSSDDANASVYSSWLDLNQGQSAALTFTCTDAYGNYSSYTAPTVYAILFRLVNEETGADLTFQDINDNFAISRVYTIDGTFSYDFNSEETVDVNFFSPSEDLWFEFGYDDGTRINRQINFGYLDDQNIGICAPFFQTFYQQRFAANSAKTIILKSNIADCYVVAGQLAYVYDTGYSLTTYTIARPYYLYTYGSGVKSYLALIDGGAATAYNIDAIEFSRESLNLGVGQDVVAFYPILNANGIYDTNTLQIYYYSYLQNNDSTKFEIYNDSNLLWTITEISEPNEFNVSFYWETFDLNNDTVLELVVTTTVDGEETETSYYFNVMGNSFQNTTSNNTWAAIAAILFFLFGITLVSVNKAFGIFGIIIAIMALFILNMGGTAWWINILAGSFIILIMYIIMVTKQTGGNLQ